MVGCLFESIRHGLSGLFVTGVELVVFHFRGFLIVPFRVPGGVRGKLDVLLGFKFFLLC